MQKFVALVKKKTNNNKNDEETTTNTKGLISPFHQENHIDHAQKKIYDDFSHITEKLKVLDEKIEVRNKILYEREKALDELKNLNDELISGLDLFDFFGENKKDPGMENTIVHIKKLFKSLNISRNVNFNPNTNIIIERLKELIFIFDMDDIDGLQINQLFFILEMAIYETLGEFMEKNEEIKEKYTVIIEAIDNELNLLRKERDNVLLEWRSQRLILLSEKFSMIKASLILSGGDSVDIHPLGSGALMNEKN